MNKHLKDEYIIFKAYFDSTELTHVSKYNQTTQ